MYSNIFILSGPSGAGEDSIIEGLARRMPLERIITTTTRAPRPGESNGKPYYFIDRATFDRLRAKNAFAECARQYNDNWYGVTHTELKRVMDSGKTGIWKMEYQGVMAMKKIFPEICSIFITVPSLKILEQRIRRRDRISEEYIQERMAYTKEWMSHADIYDFTVVNEEGKLSEAINQVESIIQSKN